MNDSVPERVRGLADEREAARRSKDYALADSIRERIREAGFEVTDTASGPQLAPLVAAPAVPVAERLRAQDVANLLEQPASFDVSVHWLVQGWPEDVDRGIESFDEFAGGFSIQHVVVDATDVPNLTFRAGVELIMLQPGTGWSAARNAGLVRSLGSIVVVADGSVEATGDVLGPLAKALADPGVGVTGPFGIVTEDLHHFHESDGPDVDAVEGYLVAFRRELVIEGLRFDEKFKFYRTADIEMSFRIKAKGLRATVTPVPVRKHEHRMWANTPEAERDRLSKRNFYRFLDVWRGRTDLTVAARH